MTRIYTNEAILPIHLKLAFLREFAAFLRWSKGFPFPEQFGALMS